MAMDAGPMIDHRQHAEDSSPFFDGKRMIQEVVVKMAATCMINNVAS
jgi:hypothetical protein